MAVSNIVPLRNLELGLHKSTLLSVTLSSRLLWGCPINPHFIAFNGFPNPKPLGLPHPLHRQHDQTCLCSSTLPDSSFCPTYFLTAVMRNYDQGNLSKGISLDLQFWGLWQSWQGALQQQAWCRVNPQAWGRENWLGIVWASESSKLTPSDTPPLIRSHLPPFPCRSTNWGSSI